MLWENICLCELPTNHSYSMKSLIHATFFFFLKFVFIYKKGQAVGTLLVKNTSQVIPSQLWQAQLGFLYMRKLIWIKSRMTISVRGWVIAILIQIIHVSTKLALSQL